MRKATTMLALCAAVVTLGGCGGDGSDSCLPEGERAVVVRKGNDDGQRFVTLKRKNGEEVTCVGNATPVILSIGDEIDGQTMRRANATKAP